MKRLYRISGGNFLTGIIDVDGSKNAALPIICASILMKDEVILHNIPDIKDIRDLLDILDFLNVRYSFKNKTLKADSSKIINKKIPSYLTDKFRASYYLLGTLINLFDCVEVGKMGGCKIGERPIDQHILGFKNLGFTFVETNDSYVLKRDNNKYNDVSFQINSLGASINVLLASLFLKREVSFYNISVEPEFIDLVEFLKTAGFIIDYDVDKKTLVVEPSVPKKKVSYQIMYDRLEAGSYAILGALIGKKLIIRNFSKYCLSFLLDTFDKMNVEYSFDGNNFLISASHDIKPIDLIVNPFPSFATDLQQIISILMLKADGISSIDDQLFPTRYLQLKTIGKNKINYAINEKIIIFGNKYFYPGFYVGTDLRGSMALLIYCLVAPGVSYFDPKNHLDRGYANWFEKLLNVGANISKEDIYEKDV